MSTAEEIATGHLQELSGCSHLVAAGAVGRSGDELPGLDGVRLGAHPHALGPPRHDRGSEGVRRGSGPRVGDRRGRTRGMNLELGAELVAFRAEVREFLEDYRDTRGFFHHEGERHVATLELYRALGKRNWLALAWPIEDGGEGAAPAVRVRAVERDGSVPRRAASARLRDRGEDDHRRRHRGAEGAFPAQASHRRDRLLVGLQRARGRVRSRRVADSRRARRGSVRPQRREAVDLGCASRRLPVGAVPDRHPGGPRPGLTILIVDATSPGITISPIAAVGGERFNEVFFDDVAVPVTNRIGDENGGWRLISESLATERHVQFSPARVQQDFDDLVAWLKQRGMTSDPVVRHRLVEIAVVVAEVEAHALAMLEAVQDGRDAVVEAAANKLAGSEAAQLVARVAGDLGARSRWSSGPTSSSCGVSRSRKRSAAGPRRSCAGSSPAKD